MKNKTRKYNIKYAGENKTINKFEMKWGNCNKSWHRERRQCRDLGQYMGRGMAVEEESRGVSPRLGSAMQNWRKSRSRMKSRNEISLVRCCCCCCWPHGTCSGAARTLDKKKKRRKVNSFAKSEKKCNNSNKEQRNRSRAGGGDSAPSSQWWPWWCTSFQSLLVALVQAATDDKHIEHNNGNASGHAHQQHTRRTAQWGLTGCGRSTAKRWGWLRWRWRLCVCLSLMTRPEVYAIPIKCSIP